MKIPSLFFIALLLVAVAGCVASSPLTEAPVAPATLSLVHPDYLEEATIILTQPSDLVAHPYTDRDFSSATTASIAWWLSPDFYDTTNMFRTYLRSSSQEQSAYPEEQQIFFGFIRENLDDAIAVSVVQDEIILFRGISPGFANTVLSHAAYIEDAFGSTSYDITIPLVTYGVRGDDGYKNVLLMSRAAGDHLLYINEGEREILLPRNLSWQVVKVAEIGELTIESDFLLFSNRALSESVSGVRLITVVPVASS